MVDLNPSRISDFGKSIKKAAPIIQEKFQLGVEAQFARMLLCVVILFYVSWTTLMVSYFACSACIYIYLSISIYIYIFITCNYGITVK